jgi:hypothetical protein
MDLAVGRVGLKRPTARNSIETRGEKEEEEEEKRGKRKKGNESPSPPFLHPSLLGTIPTRQGWAPLGGWTR